MYTAYLLVEHGQLNYFRLINYQVVERLQFFFLSEFFGFLSLQFRRLKHFNYFIGSSFFFFLQVLANWHRLVAIVNTCCGHWLHVYYQVSRSSRHVYGCHLMQIIAQCFGLFHYKLGLVQVANACGRGHAVGYWAQGVTLISNSYKRAQKMFLTNASGCLPWTARKSA